MSITSTLEYSYLPIGGTAYTPSGPQTIDVVSASSEQIIGRVPEASPADVDAAVTAARRAFDMPGGWPELAPSVRAEGLERLANELEKRSDRTACAVSMQNGMPIAISQASEAVMPAVLLRYYAGLIRELKNEERRQSFVGGTTLVRHEPIGVVGAVVPWNFPQVLSFFKLAPALAAGCTVVLKPAPETVLDAYILAEAVEAANLPPGVINIVPGGRQTGAALVEHPSVDKIAFTGSTATGRWIAETCGRLLRPVTLELGGKSAAIVLDDADLTQSTQQLFEACLMNSGQTCHLGTRLLAPRHRYNEVVDTISALASALIVGDALDPTTQIGPLASAGQRRRVEDYIAKGRAEGGRLTVGGGRPSDLNRGWFVSPTVFADVDNQATIAREEIFGPVLAVIPYDNEDQAVTIANDSEFGLGGSVWTADPERGINVARRIRTGTFGVNGYALDIASPFGGVKASGIGRELGPEGLRSYQQAKSIYLSTSIL